MELLFQLLIMAVGYAFGMVAIGIVKIAGVAFTFNSAALMVLVFPIVSALMAEGFTKLWLSTPGTLGLGGLVAFMPMLVAGLTSAIAAIVAQRLMVPLDPDSGRSSESLTGWLLLAIACIVVTLALWRFWPEPRARLW
ncbi:MAG: hypothetical protein H6887_10395 [Hoeflea sp.]|nr:hypothetical protein [Hoeflea sp.]